jgi:hypothetical protein
MFPYDDKRFVYYLIEKYLKNQLTEKQFCDEFRLSFDLELDLTMLDPDEYDAMHYLGLVAGRFSPYDEDHMNSPGALYTKEELQSKIVETKQKLMKIHPEYFS